MTLEHGALLLRLTDEIFDHCRRCIKIGNNAVFHRTDGTDVARRAADHFFGGFAHCFNCLRICINSHHGRFSYYDSLTAYIDKRIRCPQVNP
ncbi:hypothetical protein D3C80_1364090 [compost metagenome]